MIATLALLIDSIRELRAKRMFWIVLALSAMIVIGYGSIGFNADGISILYGLKTIESEHIFRGSSLANIFMEGIFSAIIVNVWLAWGAMILAIISTAGIFPDFLARGSIDLVLSKPLGRAHIFLTKYFGGLAFVMLQVLIFCLGAFLVLAWRIDVWRWKIFLAVPLVTLMFSYLYAIMVLAGIVTRSTLAALLLTVLAWVGTFTLSTTGQLMRTADMSMASAAEVYQEKLERAQSEAQAALDTGDSDLADRAQRRADRWRQDLDRVARIQDFLDPWVGPATIFAELAPKTSETVSLVQRWLEVDSDYSITDLMQGNYGDKADLKGTAKIGFFDDNEIQLRTGDRLIKYTNSRSAWYIIGSSLVFEGLVVGLALVIFVRKDY